jgi:hypothetical protein
VIVTTILATDGVYPLRCLTAPLLAAGVVLMMVPLPVFGWKCSR